MRIPDQNKTSQKGNWAEKMQHSSWIPKMPHLHHLDDDFFLKVQNLYHFYLVSDTKQGN